MTKGKRLTKAQRADIAQTQYAERMAERATKLGTPTVQAIAQLAALGWHPDALAHQMGVSVHVVRSWASGVEAPSDALAALMDLVSQSIAEDERG